MSHTTTVLRRMLPRKCDKCLCCTCEHQPTCDACDPTEPCVVIEKPAECESFKAKPEHRCPACGSTKFRGYRKLTVAQRITIGGDGNLSDDAGDEPDADLGDAEAYGDIEGPYTCAECGRDFDIDLPFGGSYLLCIAGRNQDTQRHDTIGELIAALQKLDAERVPLTITIQITQPREE